MSKKSIIVTCSFVTGCVVTGLAGFLFGAYIEKEFLTDRLNRLSIVKE